MDNRPKYVVAPSCKDAWLSIMHVPIQLGRTLCGSNGADHIPFYGNHFSITIEMAPTKKTVTAQAAFLTETTEQDPYHYQQGFGNRFASEALPGVLPQARNAPQKVQYDLYSEQVVLS